MPDLTDTVYSMGLEQGWPLATAFVLFIVLTSFTVLNMLLGVLVEVVSLISSVEKEQINMQYVRSRLRCFMTDASGFSETLEGHITKEEFYALLSNSDFVRVLSEVGVDVVGLAMNLDFIFQDALMDKVASDDHGCGSAVLSFDDVIDLALRLRGSNQATVRDVVDMRKLVCQELSNLAMHGIVGSRPVEPTSPNGLSSPRPNGRTSTGPRTSMGPQPLSMLPPPLLAQLPTALSGDGNSPSENLRLHRMSSSALAGRRSMG
jgi:hypothetical protein